MNDIKIKTNLFPLISVIVPVHNVKNFLRRSVESIVSQTYSNIEIILIDDGSEDGSAKICDDLAREHLNIIVIHQPNRGVSYARNVGLDVMHGEYVGFVDADDYIESDMYEFLYNTIESNHADIACCAYYECYADMVLPYAGQRYHDVVSGKESVCRILSDIQWIPWNKLFTSRVCKDIRFTINYISCEDALFCVQTMIKAKRIAYNYKEKYFWVRRSGSATTEQQYRHQLVNTIQAWEDIIEICHVTDLSQSEREAKFQLIENCGRILLMDGVENFPEDESILREKFKRGLSEIFWYKSDFKKIIKNFSLLISPRLWRNIRNVYHKFVHSTRFIQN